MGKERKTIEEWFKEFPEPIRTLANANLARFGQECPEYMRSRPYSLADALVVAFPWSKTDEGWDYWFNVHKNL